MFLLHARSVLFVALCIIALTACSEPPPGQSGPEPPDVSGPRFRLDAGSRHEGSDGGALGDGAVSDSGFLSDAGIDDVGLGGDRDLGATLDLAVPGDMGSADIPSTNPDIGALDIGITDQGALSDTGPRDIGPTDLGASDLGAPDSGSPDLGPPDMGNGTGDLWIEIDYSSAFSPGSPTWRYSNSPGWTSSDWAFTGETRALAIDRFNNMSVVNDPIGTVLEIGSSGELELRFGVSRLLGMTGATIEIEGRSRACCSRVRFDVINPGLGCFGMAEMSQDWTPDIVQMDFTGCIAAGNNFQAIRLDPTSGAIALRRLRLTIHDPVY